MCPQECLNISVNPGLYLWMRPTCFLRPQSYPATAYVSSPVTRFRRFTNAMSRSFPRALVSKTVVSAPRNDYFKQPADQRIQSGFLRKCISLSRPIPSAFRYLSTGIYVVFFSFFLLHCSDCPSLFLPPFPLTFYRFSFSFRSVDPSLFTLAFRLIFVWLSSFTLHHGLSFIFTLFNFSF